MGVWSSKEVVTPPVKENPEVPAGLPAGSNGLAGATAPHINSLNSNLESGLPAGLPAGPNGNKRNNNKRNNKRNSEVPAGPNGLPAVGLVEEHENPEVIPHSPPESPNSEISVGNSFPVNSPVNPSIPVVVNNQPQVPSEVVQVAPEVAPEVASEVAKGGRRRSRRSLRKSRKSRKSRKNRKNRKSHNQLIKYAYHKVCLL